MISIKEKIKNALNYISVLGSTIILVAFLFFAAYGFLVEGVYQHFKNKDDQFYFNKKGIIIGIGKDEGYSRDKFHTPTIFHTLLIQDIKDTTLFCEWETTREKYYNYHIDDTVKFDFIKKERWFTINKLKWQTKKH